MVPAFDKPAEVRGILRGKHHVHLVQFGHDEIGHVGRALGVLVEHTDRQESKFGIDSEYHVAGEDLQGILHGPDTLSGLVDIDQAEAVNYLFHHRAATHDRDIALEIPPLAPS